MKTIAFCCLHYGAPFLASSIRSVIDTVDEYVIIYTPSGSHGTRTALPCPDTREQLMAIAEQAAGSKLSWYEGEFSHEGQHRDMVFRVAPDADLILVVDSDEVFMPEQVDILLKEAASHDERNYLAYEMPFWRSFHHAIPDKLCAPVRCINTRNTAGTRHTDAFFAHFGYAQPTSYIDYKMSLHGHRADWRADWFTEKWLPNAQEDVHPTNYDFWFTQVVNPLDYLPDFMRKHPYFGMDVIP